AGMLLSVLDESVEKFTDCTFAAPTVTGPGEQLVCGQVFQEQALYFVPWIFRTFGAYWPLPFVLLGQQVARRRNEAIDATRNELVRGFVVLPSYPSFGV